MNIAPTEVTENQVEAALLMKGAAPSEFDPAYAEAHDRRILIVDDEEPIRKLFAEYLNESYSCAQAPDTQEALELLSKEPFALVLTDVQMPGLGGIELLRKIKQDLELRNAELAHRKAELERLQAQITQTEKMASLGQMAAGVAHELNNPAGFIHSNIDLLKDYLVRLERYLSAVDEVDLPPEAAARVKEVRRQIDYDNIVADLSSILTDCYLGAERIRDVVQNLRLFSRLDEADFKWVDLNEGIESTVRLLSLYYKDGRISLCRDYGELPQVNCYAALLNQVWMNLLMNAAQAIGEADGEVRISTRSKGDHVVVTFSDTGSGIVPDNVKRIFDPFFTTKPVGEGTGLGVSISHSIIERHGGKIEVKSVLCKGTTFTISIPVNPKPIIDRSINEAL